MEGVEIENYEGIKKRFYQAARGINRAEFAKIMIEVIFEDSNSIWTYDEGLGTFVAAFFDQVDLLKRG